MRSRFGCSRPSCGTKHRRAARKNPRPRCRPAPYAASNPAWHARTEERSDGSGSSASLSRQALSDSPACCRFHSVPTVATPDGPHGRSGFAGFLHLTRSGSTAIVGDSSAGAGRPRRTFLTSVSIGTSAGGKGTLSLQAGSEPVSQIQPMLLGSRGQSASEQMMR